MMIFPSFSDFPFPLLLLLSLISLSSPISAADSNWKLEGKVLELDDSNFDSAISKFDYILVDFYAPWCGHCKRLAPELDKAAAALAGLKQPVAVAKVDADKHRDLASKNAIDHYPTLKIFMHGVPTEYTGPRKADLLVWFLRKFVAPDVAVLNSDSAVRDFVETAVSNLPIFIGFGLNKSVMLNLAVKYKKKAWFSVAKDFSDDIMSVYDVHKVPALAAIHPVYNDQSVFYGPFEEKLLKEYIGQNLVPVVLPINQDSLQSLYDDHRKVVLTILEDEEDEKSKGLLKVLKVAASANRDLIFGYVGFKQWERFAESFEVSQKTQLPKMVVWNRNEEYFSVIGSEKLEETDIGTQISKFLEGYREGKILEKHISGPALASFIKSQLGGQLVLILIFVVVVVVLILSISTEEPSTDGNRDSVDNEVSSTFETETRELQRDALKED